MSAEEAASSAKEAASKAAAKALMMSPGQPPSENAMTLPGRDLPRTAAVSSVPGGQRGALRDPDEGASSGTKARLRRAPMQDLVAAFGQLPPSESMMALPEPLTSMEGRTPPAPQPSKDGWTPHTDREADAPFGRPSSRDAWSADGQVDIGMPVRACASIKHDAWSSTSRSGCAPRCMQARAAAD